MELIGLKRLINILLIVFTEAQMGEKEGRLKDGHSKKKLSPIKSFSNYLN